MYIDKLLQYSINTKYANIYKLLITRALARPNKKKEVKNILGYVESHHIIPKSFKSVIGNIVNDKNNTVFLTAKEHFIAHLCLLKMFTNNPNWNQKMNFAFHQMNVKNQYQKTRINSRLFDILKRNKPKYARLYKNRDVIYIHEIEVDKIKELIDNGYSLKMTDDFKAGRVGMMTGKKHSAETKLKMRQSNSRFDINNYDIKKEVKYKQRRKIPFTTEELAWIVERKQQMSIERSRRTIEMNLKRGKQNKKDEI